jgi:hypothetical protein
MKILMYQNRNSNEKFLNYVYHLILCFNDIKFIMLDLKDVRAIVIRKVY